MISLIIFSSLCIVLSIYEPILSVLLLIYFLLFKSFKYKPILILLFLVFQIRVNINTCDSIQKGRIVEINDKSIIVNHALNNVIISVNDVSNYHIQDEVIIYQTQELNKSLHRYGFNSMNYFRSRNICYIVKEEDIFLNKKTGFFNWISRGGFNSDSTFIQLSRTFLFQSNPNQNLDLFISMGIIYTSLIKIIELCFLKVKNRLLESICIVLILGYIGITLAFPLSLIRVLIFYLTSKFINDRMLRFGINCLICGFISPFGLTQLSFVLPLLLQLSVLFFPMKSRYIQRMCVLIIVFTSYNLSFSIMNVILYPIFIMFYRLLLSFTVFGIFIPYFNKVYFILVEYLNQLYLLSDSLFVIKGHINYLFILGFIVLHYLSSKVKFNSIICLIFTLIGIPIFSIPYFYTVTLINVGQGDSVLIQSPFNRDVILIDTGPPYQSQSLISYLDSQSIYTIDTLIVTHDDTDHSGNLDILKKKYTVKDIVFKGKNIVGRYIQLRFLEFNQASSDDNDMSLIYHLIIHSKQFLFMGDLSVKGELKLIQHYPYLKADILKVGHHGSSTSTSDELLKQIQARVALIGVGKNYYGHPSGEVIKRFNDYFIERFDTLSNGDIKIIILPIISILIDNNINIYLIR